MCEFTEAKWRIYPSVNSALIGSDDEASPVRRSAIIWYNAGLLSMDL